MHDKKQSAGSFEDGSDRVIAAMIEVHRRLGPGLIESAYEMCLKRELELRGFKVQRQVPLALSYKGVAVDCAFRMDLVVDERFVIEIKCVETLLDIHIAQVNTYLKISGYPVGLLVNFNSRLLKHGLRRFRSGDEFIDRSQLIRDRVIDIDEGGD